MDRRDDPDAIPITTGLSLGLETLHDRIKRYVRDRRPWLDTVADELESWELEEEAHRDYHLTASRYFFVCTLPVFEALYPDPTEQVHQQFVEGHFWLVLSARFADDVLDNDSDGVGLETSLFLSNLCMSRAVERLKKGTDTLDLASMWRSYHEMFSFHVEMTRPFLQVSFQDFIARHWQRGAPMFWVPAEVLRTRQDGEDVPEEVLPFLKALFDLFFSASDLNDLLPDYRHFLNTPPLLHLCERSGGGLFDKIEGFREGFFGWLEERYRQARSIAEKNRWSYSIVLLDSIWKDVTGRSDGSLL